MGGLGFLGMDIFSSELGRNFRIINVYTPYHNRVEFWNHLKQLSLMNSNNLILGGDLNFTIGHEESWGHHTYLDPLSDYMEHLMEQHHLIEIHMKKKKPTWHNRRIGDVDLGKVLDRFLIKEELLGTLTNFCQWVGSGGISDHSPIYLELVGPSLKPIAPFKVNSTWL